MLSQSARLYLEAKGLIDTKRNYHSPVLDTSANRARRNYVIMPPFVQLVMSNSNSPDKAGISSVWPNKEPESVE